MPADAECKAHTKNERALPETQGHATAEAEVCSSGAESAEIKKLAPPTLPKTLSRGWKDQAPASP